MSCWRNVAHIGCPVCVCVSYSLLLCNFVLFLWLDVSKIPDPGFCIVEWSIRCDYLVLSVQYKSHTFTYLLTVLSFIDILHLHCFKKRPISSLSISSPNID